MSDTLIRCHLGIVGPQCSLCSLGVGCELILTNIAFTCLLTNSANASFVSQTCYAAGLIHCITHLRCPPSSIFGVPGNATASKLGRSPTVDELQYLVQALSRRLHFSI